MNRFPVRVAAVLLLFAGLLLWRLPASLADAALDRWSQGAVRLAEAEGTLWRGRGALRIFDPAARRWRPGLALRWQAGARALHQGAINWRIFAGIEEIADVDLAPSGLHVRRLSLRGAAPDFLERIAGPLGRAGWEGDVALDAAGWQCSWQGRCRGEAELRWLGAASGLLPGRRLGDYRVALRADGGESIELRCETLAGDVRVEGAGRVGGAQPRFAGTLRGDAELLGRLPNVAGRWVSNAGEPGVWRVTLP